MVIVGIKDAWITRGAVPRAEMSEIQVFGCQYFFAFTRKYSFYRAK